MRCVDCAHIGASFEEGYPYRCKVKPWLTMTLLRIKQERNGDDVCYIFEADSCGTCEHLGKYPCKGCFVDNRVSGEMYRRRGTTEREMHYES